MKWSARLLLLAPVWWALMLGAGLCEIAVSLFEDLGHLMVDMADDLHRRAHRLPPPER